MQRETNTERKLREKREFYVEGFIKGFTLGGEYWHNSTVREAPSKGNVMLLAFESWQESLKPKEKSGVI